MFDWIKPYSLIEYRQEEQYNLSHHDFQIKNLEANRALQPAAAMTALGQYFTAASIWLNDQICIELEVPDDETELLVLAQVAPHFTDVKSIVEEKGKFLRMSHIRPESRVLFGQSDTGALPIVRDLYRYPRIDQWHQQKKRNPVHYSLDASRLEPYEAKDLADLQVLLAIERGKEFNILPLGWTFDARLRESVALRFFAGIIPAVTLIVDADTNEVMMLQLSKEPFMHPVFIRQEEPGQTRVTDSFLYLYLKGGLVYVIDLQGQCPIQQWNDLKACALYQLRTGERFADFSHVRGERVGEGIGLLFDQDFIHVLVDTVNRHCSSI